jgi:tetratricopeptide (TPR) repeat protein
MTRMRTGAFGAVAILALAFIVSGCATTQPILVKSPSLMFYESLSPPQQARYRSELYYHYSAGQLALFRNDARGTLTHFSQALALDEHSPELQLIVASLNLHFGQLDKAIEHAERSLELDPKNAKAAVLLGGLYTAQGKLDQAIERYLQARVLLPESEEIALYLSAVYQESGKTAKAERTLQQMLEDHPDSVVGNYELGRLALLAGKLPQSESHLSACVKVAPQFAKAQLALGLVYEKKGDRLGAVAQYKKVLALTPENNELRTHVIQLLISENDPAAALAENEKLAIFQDDTVEVHANRAMILFQQKQYTEAIGEFELVLAKKPDYSTARYFLAHSHLRLRDYDTALENLAKIAPNDRFYVNSVESRAHIFRRLGRLPEAETILKQAVAAYPEDTGLRRALGLVFSTLGRHEQAIEQLEKSIDLKPDSVELKYGLANVLDKAGQYKKGIRIMEQVLVHDPDNVDALNFVGYALADRGLELDRALSFLERAHAAKPQDGYIADSVGWALFKLGRLEEAVEKLELASDLTPDEPVILEHLGDAYLETGRKAEALGAYEHARRSHPEPDQVDRLLEKIEKLGR